MQKPPSAFFTHNINVKPNENHQNVCITFYAINYLSATPPWPLNLFFDDDVNVGGFPSQTSSHGGHTSDPKNHDLTVINFLY